MKYLIFILFPFICLSQQTVEICNDYKTFTYFTSVTDEGTIEWEVNGLYYYGEEKGVQTDDMGSFLNFLLVFLQDFLAQNDNIQGLE